MVVLKDGGLPTVNQEFESLSLLQPENRLRYRWLDGKTGVEQRFRGKPYLVLGTVEKQSWKEILDREWGKLSEALEHVADFEKVLELKIKGGWQPAKKSPRK